MSWQLASMKTMVALMLANGVEPNCDIIASDLELDPELVRAEVARKKSNAAAYPPAECGK